MEKSRQVLRAEYRREMKKGRRAAAVRTRKRRQIELEKRKAAPASMRHAAMTAVSRLRRLDRIRLWSAA